MKFPGVDNLKMDDQYFEEIFPGVWLMDDHRWAYYIWEKALLGNRNERPCALVHLDYHWDGVNDFHDKPSAIRKLVEINDIDSIYCLVREDKDVRKDSFIAPAIIRGLVDEVHFYCKQEDTEDGLDALLLQGHNARQFIYRSIESLISLQTSKPIIFDIDLDLFNINKHDMWAEGDLWTDTEIVEFLSMCSGMIQSSSVVTAAMSFGYSGTEQGTRHVTRLFSSFMERLMSSNA